jgi:hypothetical protein
VVFAALSLTLGTACIDVVYVSRPDGRARIYGMTDSGSRHHETSNNGRAEESPDVSPDATRIALVSRRGDENLVLTRLLADETGSGGTDLVLASGDSRKTRPRWSCQQDLVAFADFTAASQARIAVVPVDAAGGPAGAAVPVTSPGAGESDSGGHDFYDGGNRIVFARHRPPPNGYDLYAQGSDGSGTATPLHETANVGESLPVVSHDGTLLAYRMSIALLTGTIDRIVLMRTGTWDQVRFLDPRPPAQSGTIRALGFSKDDKRVLVAAEAADAPGATPDDRIEIFSIAIADGEQARLTENAVLDSQADGIHSSARCTRCMRVGAMPAGAPVPSLSQNGVVVDAGQAAGGTAATVAVLDYSAPPDGVNEIRIGWSPPKPASIRFPPVLFGDGPSEVDVTAFHFNSLSLKAYDRAGNAVATATHAAGQRVSQTLQLRGRHISRIDLVGAEIGLQEVCYRR